MKKYLPANLVIFLLILISLSSCLKDSADNRNDSPYYLKFKLDGNWITWKDPSGEIAPDPAISTKTYLSVIGGTNKDVLYVVVKVNGSAFPTGIYPSDDPTYNVYITYVKDVGTSQQKIFEIKTKSGQPTSKYTVNVASVSARDLNGTFSGNYLYDESNNETVAITEGEFFVQRTR